MMSEAKAATKGWSMGLLDKVKDKATQATEMAKDAAAKGQAKLDDAQSKKAADGMLRDLGAAFYATQTGRTTPTTEADMQRLVSALQQHEAEHGALTLAPESSAAAPTAAPAAAAGDAAAAPPPPPPPPKAADPSSPPPPPPTAQTL
jgi:hypothetical protein